MNLRAEFREFFQGTGQPDPYKAIDPFVKSLPDDTAYLREALRQALRAMTHEARVAPSEDAPPPKVGRSRKADALTRLRELRQSMAVDGGFKFLGDCTEADLEAIANLRREHAAATLAEADKYDMLRKALADHGVERVRDLPDEVLRGIL